MSIFRITLVEQDGTTHTATLDAMPTQFPNWSKQWTTVDQLLGIHVYGRSWPKGAIEWSVRVSNGCVRKDGTGWKGRLYYRSLTITADDVMLYQVGDGQHVFPPRAMFERTFVAIGSDRDEVAQILGFEYVNFPTPSAPFGPARESLAPVDRAHYAAIYQSMMPQLSQARANGSPLTQYPFGSNGPAPSIDLRSWGMGPFHPDGFPESAAPAGYGIDLAFGWSQTRQELQYAALAHEAAMERSPICAFDMDTGETIACTDWANNHLAHYQNLRGEPYPMTSKNDLPAFLDGDDSNYHYRNANVGTSPYRTQLEAYFPDDTAHCVRAIRRAAALAGWAGDRMAQDDLHALFEYHRTMGYGDRADDKIKADYKGQYVPPSLSYLQASVNASPGRGWNVDRAFGWMLHLGAWGKAPPTWSQRMIDTYLAIGDEFGLPQREAHDPYIPPGWLGTQHFHSVLIHVGAWTLARASGYRESDVYARIVTWARNVLKNRQLPLEPRPDGPGSFGPPKWIFTHGPNGDVPNLTTANSAGANGPAGFQEHVLALLGRAAMTDLDAQDVAGARSMLACGLGVGLPSGTLPDKMAQIASFAGDMGQYAHYWAALERALATP